MSISTDFDTVWARKKLDEAIVESKALLQNMMNVTGEAKARIDAIIATGVFNSAQMPASVKTALTTAYNIMNTANTGFSAPDVKEVLNWAGK